MGMEVAVDGGETSGEEKINQPQAAIARGTVGEKLPGGRMDSSSQRTPRRCHQRWQGKSPVWEKWEWAVGRGFDSKHYWPLGYGRTRVKWGRRTWAFRSSYREVQGGIIGLIYPRTCKFSLEKVIIGCLACLAEFSAGDCCRCLAEEECSLRGVLPHSGRQKTTQLYEQCCCSPGLFTWGEWWWAEDKLTPS